MVISFKMASESHGDSSSSSGITNDSLKYCGGGFRKRKQNVEEITIDDFVNPWNFFHVFNQSDEVVMNWCIKNGLIASELECPTCGGQMKLARRGSKATGFSFRCNTNKTHEVASRKFSFFENSKLTIQDIMVFVKSYLEGHTLFMTSKLSGVNYKSTAVD